MPINTHPTHCPVPAVPAQAYSPTAPEPERDHPVVPLHVRFCPKVQHASHVRLSLRGHCKSLSSRDQDLQVRQRKKVIWSDFCKLRVGPEYLGTLPGFFRRLKDQHHSTSRWSRVTQHEGHPKHYRHMAIMPAQFGLCRGIAVPGSTVKRSTCKSRE